MIPLRLLLSAFLLFYPFTLSAGDNLGRTDKTCVLLHLDERGGNARNETGGAELALGGDALWVEKGLASGGGIRFGRTTAGGYLATVSNARIENMPTKNLPRTIEFMVETSSNFKAQQIAIVWANSAERIRFANPGTYGNPRLIWESAAANTLISETQFGPTTDRLYDNIGISTGSVYYIALVYDGGGCATANIWRDGKLSTAPVRCGITALTSTNGAYGFRVGGNADANFLAGWMDEVSISTFALTSGQVAENAHRLFGHYNQARDE